MWNPNVCVCVCVLQKSLWDAIKSKTGSTKATAPRRKVTDQPLKMASNKAFQVSRKPQYKRATPRSPLASLIKDQAETERSFSKHSLQTSPQQMVLNSESQEDIYRVHRQSSHDPKLDGNGVSKKHENKDLIKILNKTLSPVGTPERLKKFMPHIYHESPLSAAVKPAASLHDSTGGLTGTPVLSVKQALVLIDSDLSHVNSSPQDSSQSDSFSDSLESKSGSRGCKADDRLLNALPDSPDQPDACEQRLTFFVTKKIASEVAGSEVIIKAPFTSVTVTKAKAPVEGNSLSRRKIRKSKRRLLEKTLELSDGSSDTGPGSPSLPVIDVGEAKTSDAAQQPGEPSPSMPGQRLQGLPPAISSPVAAPLSMPAGRIFFSLPSPLPDDTPMPSSPLITSSPLYPKLCVKSGTNESSPPPAPQTRNQEDLFPVHMALKSKKRKSEEFLKRDRQLEDAAKTETVKRTRVVAFKPEPCASIPQRRSHPRRPQRRTGEPEWPMFALCLGLQCFHL